MRKLDKNQQFRGGTHKRTGRPKRGPRASERHKTRPVLKSRFPVHVIMRASTDLGSLRTPAVFKAIRDAVLVTFKLEDSFHIVQYSIQRTHIHMIVEARDRLSLGRGMQAFGISAAKHINAAMPKREGKRRRGTVFVDRYHAVILTNPSQVRNTLCYVLNNWRHHGEHGKPLRRPWKIDPYSTALGIRRMERARRQGHALSHSDRLRRSSLVVAQDLAVARRLAQTWADQHRRNAWPRTRVTFHLGRHRVSCVTPPGC